MLSGVRLPGPWLTASASVDGTLIQKRKSMVIKSTMQQCKIKNVYNGQQVHAKVSLAN